MTYPVALPHAPAKTRHRTCEQGHLVDPVIPDPNDRDCAIAERVNPSRSGHTDEGFIGSGGSNGASGLFTNGTAAFRNEP